MNRTMSIALLVVGIVLLVYGISASESFASDVSRFFQGTPTDKAIWLTIVGAVLAAIGAGYTLRNSH